MFIWILYTYTYFTSLLQQNQPTLKRMQTERAIYFKDYRLLYQIFIKLINISLIHQSAFLIELGSITSEECSIRIAAEGFFEVEILLSIWDRGPVSVACAVVEWKLQIFYSIGLEVITSPQPSSDLSTQVVSDGFRSSGVDQVSVARVESNVSLSVQLKNEDTFRYLKTIFIITYDGVASGIGSLFVTSWKIIETLLGHISSKDVSDFSLISCFLESVGKSSDPGQVSLRSQVLEEDCALVSIAKKKLF